MHTLRTIRTNKGYTQQFIGQKLKMTKSGYHMIEAGKRTISYATAVEIAKLFNARPDDIFYDDFVNKDSIYENDIFAGNGKGS